MWDPLPQSPQAGEHCDASAAVQGLAGPAVITSDCLNVVKSYGKCKAYMLSKKAVYAGILRSTLNDFNYKLLTRMDKVKSHQDEAGLSGYEWWAAHCNNSIDTFADKARSCHFLRQ